LIGSKMDMDATVVGSFVACAVIAIIWYMVSGSAHTKSSRHPKTALKDKHKKLTMLEAPVDASEVAKHSSIEDCWIIVDNKIYDISDYIFDHPGGDSILKNAGGDSSEGVHGPQHPPSMWEVLKLYYIGELKT
jgi:cytochrome b involved in lipid metabolism